MTLTTSSLGLGYGDRAVIDDLTVHIPEGRVTAVVGPNACGKSTLLRGLARLLRGRIAAEGTPAEVVSEQTVRAVFGLDCAVITDPLTGTPLVLPRPRPLPVAP